MKFSVSMYSYMQKIRSGEATPFELIAKTKELGFDAIEFVDFTDFGTGTQEGEHLIGEGQADHAGQNAEGHGSQHHGGEVSAGLLMFSPAHFRGDYG